MDQKRISSESVHAEESTVQPPSEFSLRLTGPAVLVLVLALAAVIRGRGGPPNRPRHGPPKTGGGVRIAT
jgi:hypothetical protein